MAMHNGFIAYNGHNGYILSDTHKDSLPIDYANHSSNSFKTGLSSVSQKVYIPSITFNRLSHECNINILNPTVNKNLVRIKYIVVYSGHSIQ